MSSNNPRGLIGGIAIEPAAVRGTKPVTSPLLVSEDTEMVDRNTGAEPAVPSLAPVGKRGRGRPKKVRVEDGGEEVVTLSGDSVGGANIPIVTGGGEVELLSVVGNGSISESKETTNLPRIRNINMLAENLGAMLTEGCLFDPDTDSPVVSVLVPAESVKRKRGRPKKGTTPSKQPTLGPKRKPGRPRIHPIKESTGEKRPPGRPRIHPIKENTGEKRTPGRPRIHPIKENTGEKKTPGRPRIHPIKENTGEKRSPGRPRKRPIDSSQPSEAKKVKEDSEGETSDVKEEENSSSIKSGGRIKISKEMVDKILGEKVASEQVREEGLILCNLQRVNMVENVL